MNRFKKASGVARRAVRGAMDAWFQEKAEEIGRERFGGKKIWMAIRDMQQGSRSLIRFRSVTIYDEDGNPCGNTSTQHQRWRRHFIKVLNIRSP